MHELHVSGPVVELERGGINQCPLARASSRWRTGHLNGMCPEMLYRQMLVRNDSGVLLFVFAIKDKTFISVNVRHRETHKPAAVVNLMFTDTHRLT